jgi:hypothetical protein
MQDGFKFFRQFAGLDMIAAKAFMRPLSTSRIWKSFDRQVRLGKELNPSTRRSRASGSIEPHAEMKSDCAKTLRRR